MQHNPETYIKLISDRLAKRLEELGLLYKLPSEGIIRLVETEIIAYWEGVDEPTKEEEPNEKSYLVSETQLFFDGEGVILITPDNTSHPFARVRNDALFFEGHRFTIEDKGMVVSRHRDGSECIVFCPKCEHPQVGAVNDEGGFYLACFNCGTETEVYQEKWEAVGAWLIGKVEERDNG